MPQSADPAAPHVLCLAPVVTIREITQLRDDALTLLENKTAVVLDCSAVERADVSLIQLLVSARRMAGRDGTRLDLVIPAAGVVAELIRLGGLQHEFTGTGAADD